jgi:uncharacterized membrane protein YbhN (UPF0104 family)
MSADGGAREPTRSRLGRLMRSRWIRPAQAAVTVVLLLWIVNSVDRNVWSNLRGVRPETFALAVAVFASAQAIGGVRLFLLTPGLRFGEAMAATWAGYFWGNFLPGSVGGDVVRFVRLTGAGVAPSTTAGALIVDRLANLLAILGLVVFATATRSLQIAVSVERGWLYAAAALALLGLGALLALRRRFAGPLTRMLSPLTQLFRRPLLGLAVVLLSFANIAVSILAQWQLALALGIAINLVDLAQIICVLTVVVMLPISLNGLGVQEAGYVAALLRSGAAPGDAVAFSIMVRLLIVATSLLGGLLVLYEHIRPARRAGQPPSPPGDLRQ